MHTGLLYISAVSMKAFRQNVSLRTATALTLSPHDAEKRRKSSLEWLGPLAPSLSANDHKPVDMRLCGVCRHVGGHHSFHTES